MKVAVPIAKKKNSAPLMTAAASAIEAGIPKIHSFWETTLIISNKEMNTENCSSSWKF